MTTDADLLLHRGSLPDEPTVDEAMARAGFALRSGGNPGQWVGEAGIGVDLMVVPHESGRPNLAARSVRIPPHDNRFARPTDGLQAALIDNAAHVVSSLDPADARSFLIAVAGPAALITAKTIKLTERLATAPERVRAKDALDVYRLLSELSVDVLVRGFEQHMKEHNAHASSAHALTEMLSWRRDVARLAAEAARGDPSVLRQCSTLINDLIDEVKLRCSPLLSRTRPPAGGGGGASRAGA